MAVVWCKTTITMPTHAKTQLSVLALLLCVLIFVVVLLLNVHVQHFDLDESEFYTGSAFQVNVTQHRKQWLRDAFQQFDVYACEHIFIPFCIMIFSQDAALSLLLVYVYESYMLVECLLFKSTCTYFTRSTDCLIQDPVQGACAITVAYLLFDSVPKDDTDNVPAWQSISECVILLILCLNPYLEWLESGGSNADWPTTASYNLKYPVFGALYALYFKLTSQKTKLDKIRLCCVGYVLVWLAQLCAWASQNHKLIQPMQSSPLWFVSFGALCSVLKRFKTTYAANTVTTVDINTAATSFW